MNRDSKHFWTQSSLLKNDISKNEKKNLEEILKRIGE